MKELIKEAKNFISEKYKVLTTQQSDEPLTHEFEEERTMRERKENPTVVPRGLEPDTISRAEEIENIRQKKYVEKNVPAKETPVQKSNTGDEIATIIENVSNHSREAVQTVHDFVGGESRSEQLNHVRRRKNISKGIER